MRSKTKSGAVMPSFAVGLMAVVAVFGLAGSAQAKAIGPSAGGAGTPSVCDAIPGNLVTNCGFESGVFTGWTQTPADFGSDFSVSNDSVFVHSGNFGAVFGALIPPFEDTISQSIPTIAGDAYHISFFLDNSGGPDNQFTAMFGSTPLLSVTNSGPFAFTEFTDTVVATASSTPLSFAAFQVPEFFGLDDVSVVPVAPVTAVPEPASLVLLGTALFVFGVARRRRTAM